MGFGLKIDYYVEKFEMNSYSSPHAIEVAIVIAIAIAIGLRYVLLTLRPLFVAVVALALTVFGWSPASKSYPSFEQNPFHRKGKQATPNQAESPQPAFVRQPTAVKKKMRVLEKDLAEVVRPGI